LSAAIKDKAPSKILAALLPAATKDKAPSKILAALLPLSNGCVFETSFWNNIFQYFSFSAGWIQNLLCIKESLPT
jgi:hypothetical protein